MPALQPLVRNTATEKLIDRSADDQSCVGPVTAKDQQAC